MNHTDRRTMGGWVGRVLESCRAMGWLGWKGPRSHRVVGWVGWKGPVQAVSQGSVDLGGRTELSVVEFGDGGVLLRAQIIIVFIEFGKSCKAVYLLWFMSWKMNWLILLSVCNLSTARDFKN